MVNPLRADHCGRSEPRLAVLKGDATADLAVGLFQGDVWDLQGSTINEALIITIYGKEEGTENLEYSAAAPNSVNLVHQGSNCQANPITSL